MLGDLTGPPIELARKARWVVARNWRCYVRPRQTELDHRPKKTGVEYVHTATFTQYVFGTAAQKSPAVRQYSCDCPYCLHHAENTTVVCLSVTTMMVSRFTIFKLDPVARGYREGGWKPAAWPSCRKVPAGCYTLRPTAQKSPIILVCDVRRKY